LHHAPYDYYLILCLVLRLCGGSYPQHILNRAAELDDDGGDESEFYPLYNKILNYWFPSTEGYDTHPQWRIPGSKMSIDFAITFNIGHHRRPLLLVEVKPGSHFDGVSDRENAIFQVTTRLDDVGPNNQHTDRLYAISAIGKRWRACYALRGNGSRYGQPVRGIAEINSLRYSEQGCWNPDITSDESWALLQSVVESIKGDAAQ